MRIYILVLLSIPFFLLIVLPLTLYAALTGNIKPLAKAYTAFIKFGLRFTGVKVVVRGLENIPEPPCIFMANHVSYLDGPLLFITCPHFLRAMVKKSAFSLPLIGPNMTMAGFVKVDRRNFKAAARAVEEALEKLRKGMSFMVFPEGTRTRDGRLQPFKRGGFLMAVRAGVKVVPVAIKGAYEVMPRHKFSIKPGTVEIVYLPPVDASRYSEENLGELMQEVRRRIENELEGKA